MTEPRLVLPTRTLLQGCPYTPSWKHVPRTTWTNKLGGHYGPVRHQDVKELPSA